MLEIENRIELPMQVIGKERHLLPQIFLRVVGQAPTRVGSGKGAPGSTSSRTLASPKLMIR